MNDRSLWFAVGGGPIAWSVDALAAIAIDHDYCVNGPTGVSAAGVTAALVGIAIVAAGVALLAGWTAWRCLDLARADTGLGDTYADRRRFMARFGVVLSILTLFGILLRMIAVLFVPVSIC